MVVRLAANLSFLFKELPFLQRFGAARRVGFRATEFMFAGDSGYEHSALEVHEQLSLHGLEHVLLNAPAGDWAAGERGIGGIPGRDAQFMASIEDGLSFAAQVGCRKMHVMAGLVDHGADEDTFVERLRLGSVAAAEAGICLCVEPLNSTNFPGYLIPDVATALRIIEKVDAPQCKLQLDLYHHAMTDPSADLSEAIERLLPHAAHIQIANPPNRSEPGVGEVDFAPLLSQLAASEYDGYVGCEYKPSTPTTEGSLAWAHTYGIGA